MIRRLKIISIAAILIVLIGSIYYIYTTERDNFHAITHGQAYRSAQLNKDELEYYIKKYNIRSIINLRGEHPDEDWYIDEKLVSLKNNLQFYSLRLSSSREPDYEDINKLISIFKEAPRPVLIHCKAGADRSGLAAAIWKVVIDKEPKSIAKKQLSFFYGHLPFGKTSAMDRFFNKWNPPSDN
ncbi:MAG: dual specificity protein phosphatase family protein [Nitrospirae bacterium]|jgi:undecaprenyl-diphosphatase|nr:dual specificity protein phosphatase family protein [Nitrospirota bacterium]